MILVRKVTQINLYPSLQGRRLQYEQGRLAELLIKFAQSGGDAPGVPPDRENHAGKVPNWGRREVIPQHKAILDKFGAHVTTRTTGLKVPLAQLQVWLVYFCLN